MKILVTGASGYIGRKLVETLCQKRWLESVVGTDIKKSTYEHPKYRHVTRDILADLDDIFLAHQIDTVVHAAYVLPPMHDKKTMEEINKEGARNIFEACARAGVKQILHTSSTTAYGFYPDNDSPLTEESPLRGNEEFTYAKNKKQIEAIIKKFVERRPEITFTNLRPCIVVGPGFKNPMAEHLKKKFVMLPANTLPLQFVHEDDLIEIMALVLKKKIGGTFNVAANSTMTLPEMVRALGNIHIPLPKWFLYPLNDLFWFLRCTFITKSPSSNFCMMVNPWIASNKKLIQETGYAYQYNTREAFWSFAQSVNTDASSA